MKRQKYDFHEELKAYENMNIPIIPFIIPFLQKLMGVLYWMERSDREMKVTSKWIPTADNSKVRILIYEPKTAVENGPALLYMHGGGFAFQAAPHHFCGAKKLAKALGCKVVFVDYRLAPKHKFPAAPLDSFSAYQWMLSHARELEIDSTRIAVGGDSAGGNLAAVICLMAKECEIQMPKAQLLIYPFTDRRMRTESMKRFKATPMCNSMDMKKYLQMYVGEIAPSQVPYLSPAEAKSFEGLPRAYVEVAQYDCLRDEGIEYAKLLKEAGVSVELHEVFGAMHGYDIAEKSGILKDCTEKRVRFLKGSLK